MSKQNYIVFNWVRTHNLKNIDINIPKNQITTITWVSWSGKSSLAFDTVYKEWQYRYIESLSSFLRQFFNLWTRPDVDYAEGLSPSIAIEQNKRVGNIRSTVGTLTEIDDYLRLLFAKLWDIYCYNCGKEIKSQSVEEIVSEIKEKYLNEKIYILGSQEDVDSRNSFFKRLRRNRRKVESWWGFIRYLIKFKDWKILEYFYLEDVYNISEEYFPVVIYGIYDRITVEEKKVKRMKDDIIKILSKNKKFWVILLNQNKVSKKSSNIFEDISWYTDKNYCADCNISYPEFTTQNFSPNRQEWACDFCYGLWKKLQVDFDKIIDPYSVYSQAILPWRDSNYGKAILDKLATKYSIDKNVLWKDLPEDIKNIVLFWDWELLRISLGGKYMSIYYNWVEDILTQQYNKWFLTVDFQAMLNFDTCPECKGAKLKKESLNVYLPVPDSKWKTTLYNIYDFQSMTISENVKLLSRFSKFTDKPKQLVNRILNSLLDRWKIIQKLGVWHMNPIRQIDTLSGGEIQRLRLAKQLWNKLTGIVYVLDEPTIGLDTKEIKKVISAIKDLKSIWNTIIVVEHNEDFIKNSDRIVEIGPGSGDFGGYLVFSWKYREFLKQKTLTSDYINWIKDINIKFDHKPTKKKLSLRKAQKHNLKSVDLDLNLWSFTILTWPSGAWKTTIMYDIFYKFLVEKEKYIQSYIRLNYLKNWYSWSDIIQASVIDPKEYSNYQNLAFQDFYKHLEVDTITWYENIKNVLYVDQTSIWKTPRSCPATFIWVFDDIRKLFAGSEEAKIMWFTPWHFSFNSKKWACPECDWYWQKKVELQFLPDTYVPCKLCGGDRYKSEILKIHWHWKSIWDVLNMYIYDALEFFEEIPFIKEKLELMVDIGLDYLKLGQPAHTLSGGESQRIKLVKHLLKTYRWHTVYFLDEPTVWLHPWDIQKLLNVLKKILANKDSIFMIEHDKYLLRFADRVVNLDNGKILDS